MSSSENYSFQIADATVNLDISLSGSDMNQRFSMAANGRRNDWVSTGEPEPLIPYYEREELDGSELLAKLTEAAKDRVRRELQSSARSDAELLAEIAERMDDDEDDAKTVTDIAKRLSILAAMVDALDIK